MPKNRKPTQNDIARKAGVSQGLVSHVVNANKNVTIAPETRQSILDAISEIGYVPDRSARSLRNRKTNTIAVIIPDITNPYHPAFARGIQDVAEQYGYDLIIYNTDGILEKEKKILNSALQNHVDGIIGVFLHLWAEDFNLLVSREIPVVLTSPVHHNPTGYPLGFIYTDNQKAAWTAVRHLITRGCQRVALIGVPSDIEAGFARLAGYHQAISQSGQRTDPTLIQVGNFTVDSGYECMQRLLKLPVRPDGVFAINDLMAVGALNAILDAGLQIPKDIALIGFDDIQIAQLVRPTLTTIRPFQDRMGARAAEMLITRIESSTPLEELWEESPFELVQRQSA